MLPNFKPELGNTPVKTPVRDQQTLENKLIFEDHSLSKRIALGIEHYIQSLPKEKQASARQELPYLVQFGPTLIKWGSKFPDIRLVNQGIPYGGLTRYDKSIIQDKFPKEFTLPNIVLKQSKAPTFKEIDALMKHGTIQFPLMIKPLEGERGEGITFIENSERFKDFRKQFTQGNQSTNNKRKPMEIVEYSKKKKEYCLQFYQHKDDNNYKIKLGGLSERMIPTVVGNGQDSVETLINQLDLNKFHKENIKKFLKDNEPNKLSSIPQLGKKVTIVRIASIDFGVKYKTIDLSDTQQKKLHMLVKKLTQHFPDEFINAGRFDLKADSLDDLLNQIVDIIECNAGGGIPTIIYDERLPIHEKYKILDQHFATLHSIATKNKKNGDFLKNLTVWPEFLAISYKSISQKNISLLNNNNTQGKKIKEIYNKIFKVLHKTKKERWKYKRQKFMNMITDVFSKHL